MGLCSSVAQYIGKVELEAIKIEDSLKRLDFYQQARTDNRIGLELGSQDFDTESKFNMARDYLQQRIEEYQKSLAILTSQQTPGLKDGKLAQKVEPVFSEWAPMPRK